MSLTDAALAAEVAAEAGELLLRGARGGRVSTTRTTSATPATSGPTF